MHNIWKISLKISFFVFISIIIFFIVIVFWYEDYNSIKKFLWDLFISRNIIFLFFISIFSIFIWYISWILIKKIFSDIQKNNIKLKDFNHNLAHELKTPISVIYSNLDILKYWFNQQKIEESQNELKWMIKIIDGILNFSESIKITSKVNVNVENLISNYIYFLEWKQNIKIFNKEFNFSIETDEILFWRVIKNLIDNALKYSLDWKLKIFIKKDRLIFENKITKTLNKKEINILFEKFYSKSFDDKKWHGIWLPMIKDIVKILWYKLKIYSENNNFIVEIFFYDSCETDYWF